MNLQADFMKYFRSLSQFEWVHLNVLSKVLLPTQLNETFLISEEKMPLGQCQLLHDERFILIPFDLLPLLFGMRVEELKSCKQIKRTIYCDARMRMRNEACDLCFLTVLSSTAINSFRFLS